MEFQPEEEPDCLDLNRGVPISDKPATTRGFGGQGGAVSALVAILITTVFLAMAALAIDLGFGYANKAQASKAADAGALAAGADLPGIYIGSFSCSSIPSSATSKVANDAGTYACRNAAGSTITVASPYNGSANIVNVKVCKTQGTFFARVLGISTLTSCEDATAARQPSTACVVVPAGAFFTNPSETDAIALAAPAPAREVPCPWMPGNRARAPVARTFSAGWR